MDKSDRTPRTWLVLIRAYGLTGLGKMLLLLIRCLTVLSFGALVDAAESLHQRFEKIAYQVTLAPNCAWRAILLGP
jgi:hypothetical protein